MRSSWLFLASILFVLISCRKSEELTPGPPVTAENALESYLNNGDETYSWELRESYSVVGVQVYVLLLASQKWRGQTWLHQLNVFVPSEIDHDGALLFIDGNGLRNGQPAWESQNNDFIFIASLIANKNKAVTAILWQTPNQPLYNGLTEDALISFTLHNFKSDKDYTWPLLFPMVKGARRAMDAVQAFSMENLNKDINRFVVSGASKRGWTTWLTGATDDRVAAIAPMVFDVVNMPVNIQYQLEVWGDYSVQIQDYVDLGIVQEVGTGTGAELTQMIDPFSYRNQLTMPKLLVFGTNDEYWPVDAVKNYIGEMPGENFIHYVPNAGHNLEGGEQAAAAISAFFGRTLRRESYPAVRWQVEEGSQAINLTVEASADQLEGAFLWTADSEDRDFRDETFVRKDLNVDPMGSLEAQVDYPTSGFRAFYVDLIYPDPAGGQYIKCTRMFVADADEVFIN